MQTLVGQLVGDPWFLKPHELCFRKITGAGFGFGLSPYERMHNPDWKEVLWDESFYRSGRYGSGWSQLGRKRGVTIEDLERLVEVNLKYGAMAHIRAFRLNDFPVGRNSSQEDFVAFWDALGKAFNRGFLADLRTLMIDHCGIRTDSCSRLIIAFAKPGLQNLEHLNLFGNPIGADGCFDLAGALSQTKLKTLKLASCGIGDDGCVHLYEILLENVMPLLEELDLANNYIGVYGCATLVDGLCGQEDAPAPKRPSFNTLNLERNNINDDSRDDLINLVRENDLEKSLPRFTELLLTGNYLSKETVQALKNAVPEVNPRLLGRRVLKIVELKTFPPPPKVRLPVPWYTGPR